MVRRKELQLWTRIRKKMTQATQEEDHSLKSIFRVSALKLTVATKIRQTLFPARKQSMNKMMSVDSLIQQKNLKIKTENLISNWAVNKCLIELFMTL